MRVVACRCFSLLPLQFNVVNHKVSVVCVLCMGKELCEKAKSRKTEAKAMNREHSFDDDDMQLARQGYERFFNGDVNDVAIVSVQRQQEITTFVEKTPNRNQIKLSLSQEQIVKRMSGDGVVSNGVKRSQSANIQKTFITPTPNDRNHWYGGHSFDTQSLVLRRPSLIPVKVNSSRIHMSLMIKRSMQMQKSGMLSTAAGGMRKMSMPNAVLGTDDHTQAMTSLPYIPTTDAGPSAKAIPLDKKFICGFCRNTLNDPRVLDCLHTFCFDCLPDLEQPTMKSNVAKVNVVLAPGSRENSELEMSCSSPKNEGSSTETGNDSKGQSGQLSRGKSRKSAIETIASTNLKRIFSSAVKGKSDDPHRSVEANRSIRYSIDSMHGGHSSKRRISTLTEKNRTVIKCPNCSYRTEISIGGISRVPKNFLLERQLYDELSRRENQHFTEHFCGLCYAEVEAVGHCAICRIDLCGICKEAHLRQRITSRHVIEKLTNVVNPPMNNSKSVSLPRLPYKCFVHPSQELKLYCTTCDQVACHNCTILLHKGHKYEPMARAAKQNLKLVKDSLERNRQLCEYVNDSISKLMLSVKKIDLRADVIQKDIEQFLTQYFEALEAHKQTLLRQVAKAKENKHLSIFEQKKYLEKRAGEANQINAFAENLLANGNEVEILTFVGTLQRRFDFCQKSKTSIDPKIPDAFRFLPEIRAPATQAQHNIPMYGIIATQLPDPQCCVLEIEEEIILRVHRRAELRMISKDSDGRPLCHGGIILLVQARYKDATAKEILPTQISDKRDGTYLIAFTPDAVGVIYLSIRIQDKDIKGSPYEICVRALRPHSGIYHCCTFCSSKGSKTMICACNSKMAGGYSGCGHGHEGHPGRRHWSCCANVFEASECSATNSFRL